MRAARAALACTAQRLQQRGGWPSHALSPGRSPRSAACSKVAVTTAAAPPGCVRARGPAAGLSVRVDSCSDTPAAGRNAPQCAPHALPPDASLPPRSVVASPDAPTPPAVRAAVASCLPALEALVKSSAAEIREKKAQLDKVTAQLDSAKATNQGACAPPTHEQLYIAHLS